MNDSKRTVNCAKLKREAQGLKEPPYFGELGEKIYNHISQEAWDEWMSYLTMLINEGRLAVDQTKSKELIRHEMIQFLNLESI